MVCIYCGSATQVVNSRSQKRLNQVWRRRQCGVCQSVFTTHEAVDLGTSLIVRRSVRKLAPFNKDILLLSIFEACKHRPTAIADATALTQTIIGKLREQLQDSTIDRNNIVQAAIDVLSRFDKSAATIYQAYHPLAADVAK